MKDEFVCIGKITRFQGNKGEVRVITEIKDPDRLNSLLTKSVFIHCEPKNELIELLNEIKDLDDENFDYAVSKLHDLAYKNLDVL